MLARDLIEQIPLVSRLTTGAEAVRLMAEYRLSGLVVTDSGGDPVATIPGSQLLGLIVPGYVSDQPSLAHLYDEADADELAAHLNETSLADLLDRNRIREVKLPEVAPDDTLVEIAEVMLSGHLPLICVRDEGRYLGVVTMSRLMAAIALIAGHDSTLLQRRLERDIIDRGRPWPGSSDADGAAR